MMNKRELENIKFLRQKLDKVLYDNKKKIEVLDRIYNNGFVEEDVVMSWYLISPKSIYKFIWNINMAFCAFYSLFFLPIDLGFTKMCFLGPEVGKYFIVFDMIVSVVFFIDLIMKFLTPFYNKKGYLIISLKEIALTNIKTNFVPDMLCVIPWGLLLNEISKCGTSISTGNRLTMILGLLRVRKLSEFNLIIEKSNSKYLNIYRLIKLLISFFYVCHFFGCLAVGMTVVIDTVKNKFDTISFSNIMNVYSYCLLKGINVLLSTDLDVKLPSQQTLIIVFNIMSLAITANIFGYVALILEKLNSSKLSNSKNLTEKLDLLNEYLVYENVSQILRSEAGHFYRFMYIRQKMLFEEDVYKDLNPFLLSIVKFELWKEAYFKIDKYFISDFVSPSFFSKCLEIMQGRMFKKKDVIVEEGENTYDFYLICANSSVEIYCSGLLMNNLQEGDYFGETSLFTSSKKRTATVVSNVDGDYLCICGKDFYRLILDFENEREYFKNIAEGYLKEYNKVISVDHYSAFISKKGKIFNSLVHENLYTNPAVQKNRLIYLRSVNEINEVDLSRNKYEKELRLLQMKEKIEELDEIE
jgi:hypothetical protein